MTVHLNVCVFYLYMHRIGVMEIYLNIADIILVASL